MNAHRDAFPYKHIWEAIEGAYKNSSVPIAIYDDEPKGCYSLQVKDQHIDLINEEEHPPTTCSKKLTTSYLKYVINHPEEYIADPAKLDWDWLKKESLYSEPSHQE